MLLENANTLIWGMFYSMSDDGVVIIPSIDGVLSQYEIKDNGRVLRVELDWNKEDADLNAEEFKHFANSLFEIGDWYTDFGENFEVRPDEDFMAEENSMLIWKKYIKDFYKSEDAFMPLSKSDDFDELKDEILRFMAFRYCFFTSIDAHEIIRDNALIDLARAFVIKRFAKKIEQIDMLMEEHDTRSYFPLKKELDVDDFRNIAKYLNNTDNIKGHKGQVFYDQTRCDSDIENLYKDLMEIKVV